MVGRKRLREKWPWNRELLDLYVFIPIIASLLSIIFLYSYFGNYSFYFLIAIPGGILFRIMYGTVGKRVASLKIKHSTEYGEIAECLTHIGIIEAPGIALLQDTSLKLVPIVGDAWTVQLSEILSLHEGKWMHGKYLWGKRAFLLKTPEHKRIAFAVAESIGEKWSAKLNPMSGELGTNTSVPDAI